MKNFYEGGRAMAIPTLKRTLLKACWTLLVVFAAGAAWGQEVVNENEIVPLEFGRKVPEAFWEKEHLFYSAGDTVRKTLEEYRGKALILDFWSTWCGGCIANFKYAERVNNIFKEDLNVLLVNALDTKDSFDKVDEMHQRTIPSKWEGTIPSIIFDEYLKGMFPHTSVPCYVWLTKGGIFRATTIASFVGVNEVANFLNL